MIGLLLLMRNVIDMSFILYFFGGMMVWFWVVCGVFLVVIICGMFGL